MSLHHRVLSATLVLSLFACATAPEEEPPTPVDRAVVPGPVVERESAFAELLTGVRLVGFFTQSDQPDAEPKQDSYAITRVSKAEGDKWLFEAVIEFGKGKFPFALKLPVLWAGDTPVISVTDMSFPMVGSYTARVLFHDDQYVGIWSGTGHGGQMWGRVVRDTSDGTAQPSSSTSTPASD